MNMSKFVDGVTDEWIFILL